MKIYSIEFTNNWSWGLIFSNFNFNKDIKIKRVFLNDGDIINTKNQDIIMSQNVTLLKKFKERLKTICRLGGNYNFDDCKNKNGMEQLLLEMSKCYCLIATNKKLYEIAKVVNPRTYLIPNGLDLSIWKPVNRYSNIIRAGFCGNITNEWYREYKGYDIALKACDNLGIKLQTALYKDKQIPHDEMQEKFYSQIDVLIHPTKGEGSSCTLMEAAASGIPIITTREAGFHGEMMDHKQNVLFCDRTVRSIQDQLFLLIKFPALRNTLSKNVRLFAEEHHDINKISEQYNKIFNECYFYNKNEKIVEK